MMTRIPPPTTDPMTAYLDGLDRGFLHSGVRYLHRVEGGTNLIAALLLENGIPTLKVYEKCRHDDTDFLSIRSLEVPVPEILSQTRRIVPDRHFMDLLWDRQELIKVCIDVAV